jgi:hypothetical protein
MMLKNLNISKHAILILPLPIMKSVKNSVILFLLFLTLFSSLGHELIDHFTHATDLIENSTGSKNSGKTVIHESSFENDHFFTIPGITRQPYFSFRERTLNTFLFLPGNLNSSVWLPPELS